MRDVGQSPDNAACICWGLVCDRGFATLNPKPLKRVLGLGFRGFGLRAYDYGG